MSRGTPPQGSGGDVFNPLSEALDAEGFDIDNVGKLLAENAEFTNSKTADVFESGVEPRDELLSLSKTELSEQLVWESSAVFARGNYAYVIDNNPGVVVSIDVSNPKSPRILDSVTYGASDQGFVGMYVNKGYVYVATGNSQNLNIYDRSNPTNLSLAGSVSLDNATSDVFVKGDYAYVGGSAGDYTIIDVSDPTSPTEEAAVNVDITVLGSHVIGDFAYVPTGSGLGVLDVSDPTSPEIVNAGSGSLTTLLDVQVRGNHAFVADQNTSSIGSLDISDPTNPTAVDSVSSTDMAQFPQLTLRGNFAYVSGSSNANISAVDISDPASLEVRASGLALAAPTDIMAVDDRLYVACSGDTSGLVIFGEEPHLDSGTDVINGGQTPGLDTTLTNVSASETDPMELIISVREDPGFNADYAFNYDWGFQWDDTNSEVDINLTVNWDTDPGAGNDVDIRWDLVAR